MLHRPDCAVVAGRTDLHGVSASGDGLNPCSLCNPFDAVTWGIIVTAALIAIGAFAAVLAGAIMLSLRTG